MRLLIVTQVVDSTDSSLGFFHTWIEKMAADFDSIEVICLYKGVHTLPANVRVHSLGKEKGSVTRLQYVVRFLRLVWCLRNRYDPVFVHMNQEYVLLGGLLWKTLGKEVYMWRNHYAGSFLTRIAGTLCTKVFCTSTHSYTARFLNTILMPVGVDVARFQKSSVPRKPNSILFLGRMTPSKKPDLLLESLILLSRRGIDFTATFCGPVLPEDASYVSQLKERAHTLGDRISFLDGVPHNKTSHIFQQHEMYVNLGASGMFDKTLFEASASGCLVVATSEDFQKKLKDSFTIDTSTPESLAHTLEQMLSLSESTKEEMRSELHTLAQGNSLNLLISKVASVILA